MCVGSNCDGSPLPTVYQINGVLYPPAAAAAGTATAAIPLTFTIGGSHVHACPSCKCLQVQP